jgi:hypothetical protein
MRLLLLAAVLALGAILMPASFSPFTGPLQFTAALGADAATGTPLPVPLISQYQGIVTDNFNCGPASVAAILRTGAAAVGGVDDATLVAEARAYTGEPRGDTDLSGLRNALAAFGVPSAPLLLGDGAGDAADPLAAVQVALRHGAPVLALVDGATFGRGATYGDHFIVIRGMDMAAGTVDVVDPDTQQPRSADWQPGGIQTLSAWLVRQALHDAAGADGIDALAIDARRVPPATPRHAVLALAGVLAGIGVTARRGTFIRLRRWRPRRIFHPDASRRT